MAKYPYMDDHHLNNITKLGKKKNTESGLGVESKSVFGLALGRYKVGITTNPYQVGSHIRLVFASYHTKLVGSLGTSVDSRCKPVYQTNNTGNN